MKIFKPAIYRVTFSQVFLVEVRAEMIRQSIGGVAIGELEVLTHAVDFVVAPRVLNMMKADVLLAPTIQVN